MPRRNRHQSGSRAHASHHRGAAWEQTLRGNLLAWAAQGVLTGWEQRGIPARYTQARGAASPSLVPIATDHGRPVDFSAWNRQGIWFFDAKHMSSDRWQYRWLKPEQARRLTFLHCPEARRFAGLAVQFGVEDGGRLRFERWFLNWGSVGPLWELWAGGGSERGGASLSWRDAGEVGRPWGSSVFQSVLR